MGISWDNIMGKHSTEDGTQAPRQAADVLGSFQLIPSEHPEFDASFPNLLDGIGDSILHRESLGHVVAFEHQK